jgi:LysM repeat protein
MRTSRWDPRPLIVPVLATLLAGTSGCMTSDYAARDEMEKSEDVLLVQEDVRRLAGRVEAVELELQRMDTQAHDARSGQDVRIQSQLDELDRRIKGVEAARQSDKQEIIDKLSSKIAEIVGKSSSSGAARRQQNVKRSSSDTGYEHEVKPGESLSAIAAAYGVTAKIIMDNNSITDPNKLRVGQKLFIPQ